MRFSTPFSKAATVCAAATLSLGLSVGTAYAVPPGGASGNTPGTSSTVSPTVKPGGVISFNLSGFPQNTMVSVKIDDGDACPADAPQGACVVHQQKSDGNGNVSGSFVLPRDLKNGEHTLRFLATGTKKSSKGGSGVEPYSNKRARFSLSPAVATAETRAVEATPVAHPRIPVPPIIMAAGPAAAAINLVAVVPPIIMVGVEPLTAVMAAHPITAAGVPPAAAPLLTAAGLLTAEKPSTWMPTATKSPRKSTTA